MYYELILNYNGYLKHLVAYKMNQDLLVLNPKEVADIFKEMDTDMLHFTYESFENIVFMFWKIMEKEHFCAKTRLFRNVITLMVRDLF